MAKITPKIRTVLLIVFLLGSSITYANYSPSSLNFLDIGYLAEYNTITADPYTFKSFKEKQIHNLQKPFDFSIEKKISQIFGFYNLNTFIKKNIYGNSLKNYLLSNSIGQPINKSAGHSISLDSKTNVSCNGGNDGTIAITVTGGTGPYTYIWSGNGRNDTSEDISSLSAGTYTVTVSDSESSVSSTHYVSEPAILSATVAATQPSCYGTNNGSITISSPSGGTGTYQYSINGGSTWTAGLNNPNLAPGTYDVRIRDAANTACIIDLGNQVITYPDVLSATVANTQPSCFGTNNGSISISSPAGGYGTYQYSINGGSTWTAGLNNPNLAPGTYDVRIRDAANTACIIDLGNQVITYPDVLSATVANTQPSCFGTNNGSISISSPAGGYGTYQYSINGGSTWTAGLNNPNLAPGTYDVRIRDAANTACVIDLGNQVITAPEILSATVESTNVTCNGVNDGTISITNPQGGYGTYEYSINNGTNWQDSGNFGNLNNATYQVVIRDAANTNCTITLNSNLTITQPTALSATVTSTNVTCNGANDGTISVTNPAGGYGTFQYSINNGGTWQDSGEFSGLGNATYHVVIRDAANTNCTITLNSNLTITQPPVLNATVTSTNLTCNGANDGTISVTNPQGGYGTFQYSINNGTSWQDTGNFGNLNNATYQVLIRDKANINCTITLNPNLAITQPQVLNATVTSTNVTCNGATDGTISITNPQGGYGTYEYSINNGTNWQDSGEFSGLGNATYQVVIRDAANTNCTITLDSNLTITQPPVLNATVTSTNVTCNGANDGTISVTNPQGGYGTFEYSINNGTNWQDSGNFGNLNNATYQVVIRDAANTNCTITLNSNLTITQPPVLNATVTSTNV
ncbi:beta strand repeat-containing protein, partial [Gillisia sp. Q332]|uniref:beta strand repeat-containing protein n=1 Tax=Gillisia xinjiangensis TaxID=3384765 RepID=UPI00391AFFB5